jgi:hypothetical protein
MMYLCVVESFRRLMSLMSYDGSILSTTCGRPAGEKDITQQASRNIQLFTADMIRFGRCYGAQIYLPVVSLAGIWLSSAGFVQFRPLHFTAELSKRVGCIVEIGAEVTVS